MKKIFTGLAAGTLLVSFAATAHANLVTNGNFATGTSAGWTLTGPAVAVVPYATWGLPGTYAGSAYGAVYGFSNQPAGSILRQAIATTAGTSYTLSFDYGSASVYTNFVQSLLTTVTDTTTSANILSQTVSTAGSGTTLNTTYTLFPSYTFTATGSSTTLSFTDVSAATISVDAFLTNVSVIASPLSNGGNGVPEPETLSLLGIGIMGIGANMRRRNRNTKSMGKVSEI